MRDAPEAIGLGVQGSGLACLVIQGNNERDPKWQKPDIPRKKRQNFPRIAKPQSKLLETNSKDSKNSSAYIIKKKYFSSLFVKEFGGGPLGGSFYGYLALSLLP